MAKYITREIEAAILKAAKSFPALVITGARQTGKSTLIKKLFPQANYISFDALNIKNYAQTDPKSFLEEYGKKALILDEIQEAPEILSFIKLAIDQDRKPGRFIITGSQQFSLMEGVQESLAGRAAILELNTFSFSEISSKIKKYTWQEICHKGFYPEIWVNPHIDVELWHTSYIKTFIDRDISKHLQEKNIYNYGRFLELLAARISQELNISNFAKELGLDQKTIQTWISFLTRSQIIFLLPPYHQNLGKRITKKPKLYFHDTGLVASLTRHKNPDLIKNGPISGAFYENLIISEINKQITIRNRRKNLFYFRENNGLEIDLIIDDPINPIALEIKSTMTPSIGDLQNLNKFQKLSKDAFKPYLVHPGNDKLKFHEIGTLNHFELKNLYD